MKSPTEKCCEFIRLLMSEHGMRQIAVEDKCGSHTGDDVGTKRAGGSHE